MLGRQFRHEESSSRGRVSRRVVVPALVVYGLFGVATASAQVVISSAPPDADAPRAVPRARPADPATFPRGPEGKPDFTGIWSGNLATPREPLNPAYQAKADEWDRAAAAGTPYATSASRCIATGMPQMMVMLDLEFIQTAKQVTIVMEEGHEVRRIYLDGRTRPDDWDPSYDGYSVGHWEGDTLVVDTTDLHGGDGGNGWLSTRAGIVERISMVDPNTLADKVTVTDPDRLTRRWTYTSSLKRAPKNRQMQEVVCENNRNLPDANGLQTSR